MVSSTCQGFIINDYINAINFLLTTETIVGMINLVAPEPERNQVFTQALAESLDLFAMIPIPSSAFKVFFGELSILLLSGQRVLPQVLIDNGFKFSYLNVRLAMREILEATSYKMID